MTRLSHIVRQKEEEDQLKILNKYFETVTYEKHPDAMLNLIFTEAYEKVLGNNFRKQRISKRKELKIKEEISNRLKRKYGRWISLNHFKVKSPVKITFSTNFNRVYKTPQGILYGSPTTTICNGIYYTSHCLERFEERTPKIFYETLCNMLKNIIDPTSADILIALVISSNFEYGIWNQFYYLNVTYGVLALENLEDAFIAKTFLTPNMLYKDMTWFKPLKKPDHTLNSFSELLKLDSIKIQKPDFINYEPS